MAGMTVVCVDPYRRVESMRTLTEKEDREVRLDACGEVQGNGRGERNIAEDWQLLSLIPEWGRSKHLVGTRISPKSKFHMVRA